ncbi:MAG: hypothetical protein Q8942_06180 [Bacillota bacterium]|nr:hypothetical protein [Bacillota bacterium]
MAVEKKEKVKLDQLMKVMFKLSKKVTINLLNGLFEENYNPRDVTIQYTNNEFVLDSLEKIYGDMFIRVQSKSKVITYHIEFQTQNDKYMSVRMFRYGFEKATETFNDCGQEEIKLDFPKQLVIFLEENSNIKDSISFILKMPDGSELKYKVPTMKYWEYSEQDLVNKKMYALLPFQVFKSRKVIESISNSTKTHEEKAQLINVEFRKLIKVIEKVANISSDLFKRREIVGADFEKILLVLNNISDYLYNKYGEYKLIEEVNNMMLTTLYNPILVKKEVAKELEKEMLNVARTALEKGLTIDVVAEITKLDIETVKKIQEQLAGKEKS